LKRLAFYVLTVIAFTQCSEDEIRFTSLDSASVHIISPRDKQVLTPGDTARFEGIIFADTSLNTGGLRVVWESSLDGVIFEGRVNSDFRTTFATSSLSKNIHKINLKVYNEIESVLEDSIMVYNLIKLDTINPTDHSLTLTWNKVLDSDVSGYKLFRARRNSELEMADPIYTTLNANDTTYVDKNAQIGSENYYRVMVVFDDMTTVPSHILSVRPGIFNDLGFPLLKILADKERNLIYGLVAPQDLDDNLSGGYGIAVLNAENLQVVNRIFTTERFVDISLSPSNDHLYAATRFKIYEIELPSFNSELKINGSNAIHRIHAGINNRLYYQDYPGRYCSCNSRFRIVDLKNSTVLNYLGPESYHWGEFTIDPETNTLYHGNRLSEPTIVKFSTMNDVFTNFTEARGWGFLTTQILYRDGKVFWHNIIFDSNLERLGDFENNGQRATIMDVSPDGKLAFGWGGIFNVHDQVHLQDVAIPTYGAQFIKNRRLIVFSLDYYGLKSTIYRYSF